MNQDLNTSESRTAIGDSDENENDTLLSSKTLIDLSPLEQYLSLKRVLLTVSILLFLIAWNRGVALLYAMDALIIATLVVAWVFPLFNIRQVQIELTLSETAHEGEAVAVAINTQKTGFFNRYMIEIWGDFPFASDNKHAMKLIGSIGKPAQHTLMLTCDLRGCYTLDSFKLQTGFPLGLIHAEKWITLPESKSILIYPTPLPVNHFDVAHDPSHSAMHLDNNPKAGGHDDYIGVREYRHGDSPRHIHWPSSARRGELVVREFQQNSSAHLTIVLDLDKNANVGRGRHSTLEYAIKITASLIQYTLAQRYSFSVYGLGKAPLEISSHGRSQSVRALQNAMETLASVKANGDYSYIHAVRQHLGQHRRSGTIVLFDNQNTMTSLLPELQAQQYYPLVYKFDRSTFSQSLHDTARGQPIPTTLPQKNQTSMMTIWQISHGCDLQALFV